MIEAGRRRSGGVALAVGSHNVRSIRSSHSTAKVEQATRLWRRLRLDVVLLQEHNLEPAFGPARLRTALRGWSAAWAHTDSGGSVAILVRTELQRTGRFRIERVHKRRNNGRVIAMEASWGHHRLLIANAHLPNDPTARKLFITENIKWVRDLGASRTVLLGGDFNFVPSPALDRFSAAGSPDAGSRSTQRCWQHNVPDLIDVFRHGHPTARCYTRFATGTAARLDRFYVSPAAIPHIVQAKAADNQRRGGAGAPAPQGTWLSDHRPILLRLLPLETAAEEAPPRSRRRRVRLHFLLDDALATEFQGELQALADSMPAGSADRLHWYPGFKRGARTLALRYAGRWRRQQEQRHLDPEVAVRAAMSEAEAGQAGAIARVIAAREACAAAAARAQAGGRASTGANPRAQR